MEVLRIIYLKSNFENVVNKIFLKRSENYDKISCDYGEHVSEIENKKETSNTHRHTYT